ncbi:MAG: hypothetical protein CMO44_08545 [Verrucomicrobiales bacterium]|nr:hypothetical protein [Verrucomicrobiales bacterium]
MATPVKSASLIRHINDSNFITLKQHITKTLEKDYSLTFKWQTENPNIISYINKLISILDAMSFKRKKTII